MNGSYTSPAIACNLDALSPSERARRSELARMIQKSSTSLEETDSGYRVQLPDDSEICERTLELILLERRCCPFLFLALAFDPGNGAVALAIGGAPGVKKFLTENGILGCAQLTEQSACC
ncbi:MAG: hypothetical protein OEM22_02025 [Acidimicrobiia bacterium]|nr:hypothetical protein [Acidimicrobiia bacterium]